MKNLYLKIFVIMIAPVLFITETEAAKKKIYLEKCSPEEKGLNFVKITNEVDGISGADASAASSELNYAIITKGYCKNTNFTWFCPTNLTISPDGKSLAYLTHSNNQDNVLVSSVQPQGMPVKRISRTIFGGLFWGSDNQLYFGDNNNPNFYVSSIDADAGSLMTQHTKGEMEVSYPVLSSDGNMLFFTRWEEDRGPSIWVYNKKEDKISSCTRGYNACPIPDTNDAFYCVRNNADGKSEIWYVNYVKGQETLILSDINCSFTNPALSPDGKWLLLVGNAVSSISKQQNLDIFAVRTDGTNLTQLTFHPEHDCCPVWSKDGRSIYFISSREDANQNYNVWRMNFVLDF